MSTPDTKIDKKKELEKAMAVAQRKERDYDITLPGGDIRTLRDYDITLPGGDTRTLRGYEPNEMDFNRLTAEARQNPATAQENFLINIFQKEFKAAFDALLDEYPMIESKIADYLLEQLGAKDKFEEREGERRQLTHAEFGVFCWSKPTRQQVKEHNKKMQSNALRGMKHFVFKIISAPTAAALEELLAERPGMIMPLYLAISSAEGMGAEIAGARKN